MKNVGNVPIPDGTAVPLTMRFEEKAGSAGTPDRAKQKIEYVSHSFTKGVAPGETVAISKVNNGPWVNDLWLSGERAGDYTLTVSIDKEAKLAESNRANNQYVATMTVKAPARMQTVALERAARAYASTAPPDSVAAMLTKAAAIGDDNASALVKGLSEGYDYAKKRKASAQSGRLLASLHENIPTDAVPRLHRLLEAWGLRDANADLDPNAQVIKMKTVREEMRFDLGTFTVKAGMPVTIILENPDAMQHNLVIGKPKSTERIGKLADAMITAKDGAERNYVPSSPDVLAATALVNPSQTVRLTFKAPDQPGDYPYLCTFPGHWRLMKGVMKVVNAGAKTTAK